MPPAKGSTQINVSLPDEIAIQLTTLAASYDGSKSKVIETLIRAHLEANAGQLIADSVHQHLATVRDDMVKALHAISEALTSLTYSVHTVEAKMQALETQDNHRYGTLLNAFDRLKAGSTSERTSLLHRFRHG